VHELHQKINDKIAQNNVNYELQTDARNKLKTFNVGEIVKRLHACSADPFQFLNKLNHNVYVIDFGNVKDLV